MERAALMLHSCPLPPALLPLWPAPAPGRRPGALPASEPPNHALLTSNKLRHPRIHWVLQAPKKPYLLLPASEPPGHVLARPLRASRTQH